MNLPRPYQSTLVDALRGVMPRIKTMVLQLCTGGGKTNLAAWMIKKAQEKGNMVFFVVHRRDLLFQTSNTFRSYGIAHSFICAGKPFNPFSSVYVCSIETLKRRLEKSPIPKILFIDECHLSASKGWSEVIEFYRSKGCWIIGLSATPWRLDSRGLDDLFEHMVCGPSMRELIDMGFLSDYKYYAPSSPDLSGIKTTMGDFNKKQLNDFIAGENVLTGDAITHYKKYSWGKRAVVYCCSIKHSQDVTEAFNAAGIPAEHMDGETPDNERRAITQRFASGHTMVLSNVDLITTGYDLASQSGKDVAIETIILLRPTQSLSLYLQMVGRGLRPKAEPAIILDHANCAQRHGLPDEPREWSLQGREKDTRNAGERSSPIFQCAYCYFVQKPALVCSNCGKEREIQSREIEQIDGELVELDKTQMQQQAKIKQAQARTLDEMIAEGYRRGYAPGKCEFWAAKVISSRNAR